LPRGAEVLDDAERVRQTVGRGCPEQPNESWYTPAESVPGGGVASGGRTRRRSRAQTVLWYRQCAI